MTMRLSLTQKIVHFLKANPNKKYTARQIAKHIIMQYADEYQNKKLGFQNEKDFLNQMVAEVGSNKESILKNEPNIIL